MYIKIAWKYYQSEVERLSEQKSSLKKKSDLFESIFSYADNSGCVTHTLGNL